MKKIRKIEALIMVTLAIALFAKVSIHLYYEKLSLPSVWTPENEGRFVAYGLELWAFFFIIPIVISLFLLAYLIYPSRFERFSIIIKTLFMLLAIGGFGVTILLSFSAAFYNGILSLPFVFLGTWPFWLMGIFAILSFKKIK